MVELDPVPPPAPKSGDLVRVGGAVGAWVRGFPKRPQFQGQRSVFPNIEAWLKIDYEWDYGANRVSFKPFARYDILGSRSIIDLREAYYLRVGAGWDVLAGVNTVRWGVVESRRLVNVINQIDLGWSVDGDDLLGQPMINTNFTSPGLGTLSLYALFGFREQQEWKQPDRFRLGLIPLNAVYQATSFERDFNFAARYSTTFGAAGWSVDAAVSYFHGIGREPRYTLVPTLSPNPVLAAQPQLLPIYGKMDQVGLETVATSGALQLKFEGVWRSQFGQSYVATVAGAEYSFFNVWGSGADVGILAEHLTDNRSPLQPPTIYDHDIFVGGRLLLNDPASTRLLGGYFIDYKNWSQYATVKFGTRLWDHYLLEIETRYFIYAPPSDPATPLLRDSFIQSRVTRFF